MRKTQRQTSEKGTYKHEYNNNLQPFPKSACYLKAHPCRTAKKYRKNLKKEDCRLSKCLQLGEFNSFYCRLLWTRHCLRMQLPRTTTHKFKSSQQFLFAGPVWNSDDVVVCLCLCYCHCHIVIITSSSCLSLANFMPCRFVAVVPCGLANTQQTMKVNKCFATLQK